MGETVKEGVFSLWVGKFEDEDSFFEYLEQNYEGGVATSGFMKDFDIDWYDADYAAGDFFAERNAVEALKEVDYSYSFSDDVFEEVLKYVDVNSMLVIYDCNAVNLKKRKGKLCFVGAFPYKK